jgi:hypothetical protein
MAQSQMNLTIGIGVDQGKLDADIRLARAKMQQLAKDANAAAREGVRTGDRATADAASRAFTQQEQVLRGLTNQKKAYLLTTNASTVAHAKEAKGVGEVTRYLLEFGRAAGVTTVKVRDLRLGIAGLATAEFAKAIANGVTSINDLQAAAREANLSPAGLQGLRDRYREIGLAEKDADASTKSFAQTLRDSRLAAAETHKVFGETLAKPGEELDYDPTGRLQRRIVTSAEASEALNKAEAARRKTDPFERAGLHAENYAQTIEGTKQAQLDMAKSVQAKVKTGNLDEASKLAADLGFNLERDQKLLAELATTGYPKDAGPKPEDIEMWDRLTEAIAKSVTQVRKFRDAATLGTARLLTGEGATLTETEVGGQLGGMASGGYVRGPGSGTSDSIFARLSNGEYIVNAASVRRLGVGYLDSLNATRFAEGGLVSAASSGGRPVHLHLGSSSFALSGSSGVVDALVSHAHGQQMRSAGVKPSWFAGRPSGR